LCSIKRRKFRFLLLICDYKLWLKYSLNTLFLQYNDMMKKNILGIDWGSKYVGLAYIQSSSGIILPIGYLLNTGSLFFELAGILQKQNIGTVVLGWPKHQVNIQEKIQRFIKNLQLLSGEEELIIEKIDEDYTSVQAGEIVSSTYNKQHGFKKNPAEDTISAMIILERWMKK